MLSFYEDASHSVIADRLKLPLGTVKSRLRLALKKLDGLLDPAVYGGMS
jgi:RNA polymerase sigma-70 factor, ECF subfamily